MAIYKIKVESTEHDIEAVRLNAARIIDGVSFDGAADITHYGTCSTAAATAAKTVSLSGFTLTTGARVAVKFTVTNTASSPTLNVNSTGAKAIYYKNGAISASYLKANYVYEFVYDGTNYVLIGDIDTNVTQTVTTSDAAYPILLAPSGQTATTTTTSYFDSGVTLNPSTNTIAANVSGNATTATTATKLGSSTIGGSSQPIYLDSGVATQVSAVGTAYGGTGATSVSGARTNLDVYSKTEVDTAIDNSKNTWYGTCPTAENTAAKVVTTNTGDFSLTTGNIVYVLFTYAAYSNSTLNVDGTGAIAIKTAGTTDVTTYQWAANEAIGFVYDGTYFRMLDGMVANTTYYGMTKLSSSTSSTSTTMAATPSAVKSAYDLANTVNTAVTNLQSDVDSLSSEIANLLTYEDWVFTLQDGSTTTKQVYTGSLSTDSWTFTLEDGTTVTKGVYIG